jgi:dihydroorotase-like cyclic amidohydrolase
MECNKDDDDDNVLHKIPFLLSYICMLYPGLSLFWTEARKRSFSIADVSRFLSHNPSKLCGLQHAKGQLKEGMDADLVIWNPEAKFKVCILVI